MEHQQHIGIIYNTRYLDRESWPSLSKGSNYWARFAESMSDDNDRTDDKKEAAADWDHVFSVAVYRIWSLR